MHSTNRTRVSNVCLHAGTPVNSRCVVVLHVPLLSALSTGKHKMEFKFPSHSGDATGELSVDIFFFERAKPWMGTFYRTEITLTIVLIRHCPSSSCFMIIIINDVYSSFFVSPSIADVPVHVESVLVNDTAQIKCDVSSNLPNDRILLVVWYKDNVPIYR